MNLQFLWNNLHKILWVKEIQFMFNALLIKNNRLGTANRREGGANIKCWQISGKNWSTGEKRGDP